MHYFKLLKKYPAYLSYGLVHYFFTAPGQTFFISLYVGYFTTNLDITQVDFDLYYSIATLLSALSLPWLGQWIDKIRLQNFSLWLGLALIGFCGLASLVDHVITLLIALYGLRLCGQGLMGLTASTATARFFTDMRGQALSLVSFGVSFSEIILPLLFTGFLLKEMSWQASWWVMAALVGGVFMPLVLGLVKRDSPFQFNLEEELAKTQGDQPDSNNVSRQEVLRRPSFYLLNLVSLFPPFFLTGIIINKGLIGEANGWSEEWLALGLSVFGLTRLIANLIGGPLIDRFTAVRVFSFMLIPLMIGTLLLTMSDHPWIVIGFFLASGITASLNGLASTATWAELYGTRYLGAIRSMASTFMVFSTAAAPLALGWALDQPGQENTTMFASSLVMFILTLAAFWQVRRLKLA